MKITIPKNLLESVVEKYYDWKMLGRRLNNNLEVFKNGEENYEFEIDGFKENPEYYIEDFLEKIDTLVISQQVEIQRLRNKIVEK